MFKSIFNNFFRFKNSEEFEIEQKLKNINANDVIREIDILKKINNKESILEMPEVKEKDTLEKVAVDEVVIEESATEATEVESESKTEDAQIVSEETEVQDELKNEDEGIEPTEVSETVETKEEIGQEEPQETIVDECKSDETEQSSENSTLNQAVEVPANTIVNVVETKIDTENLINQINQLKAEKLEQEIKLAKMNLAKEVEKDYSGLPKNLDDKVELIYEIKNSTISNDAKDFIFESLKSLSNQNLKACEELGYSQEVEIDERVERDQKIQKAMQEHGLTENQAFLFINGERSLAEAKKASERVNKKRK